MIKSFLCFTIVFLFTVFNNNAVAQGDILTILHFNDSHSTLSPLGPRTSSLEGTQGGMPRVASVIGLTQATEPNVLLLHAGDVSIGDLFFTKYFAAAEFQLMHSLGFEAMAVGNHEFDLTPDALLGALASSFPPGSGFPLISSNLIFNGSLLLLEEYIEPYTVIQKGPVKVGIFSLLTPETNVFSQPAPIIVSDAIVEKAAEMVTTLSMFDCDVIILLSHLGVNLDQVVASYVPGIDVIISGHDHYKFESPLTITDPLGGTTLLVQARSNYMYAGKMKLEIDGDDVQLLDYQLIHLDESIPEEPTVKAVVDNLIAGIEATYGPVYSQQMGYANAFFEEEATDLMKLGAHDTPIGNLVTDAFKTTFVTDIAIQAGGSTALPLWEGPLVGADVYRVNGYGFNTINGLGFQMVTFDIEGQYLLGGLEFGLSEIEKNDEFLIQVSGMQYFYDGSQPSFARLKGVLVNEAPIDPTATYSVAASESVIMILDYLGLPYSNVQLYEGVTEFQVVADYIINQGGFIHPKKLGRILNVGDQESRGMLYAGGWINSESGFYLPDPSVTGRAFFTIKLRNKFTSGEPAGKVRFNLRKANFRFRSTECEWLLIENSFATVVGKGKVNGTDNYGFLLTAQSEIEGMECPQGGVRIIIWDSDENIVYDNLLPQNMNGWIFIRNIIGNEENTIAKTEDENLTLPVEYALEQNYPNPFNPTTTIKYSIPETGNVELKVYDIIGNEVAILVDETKAPGSYETPFDASKLASGIYIYSLRAANFVQTKKMILMK
ncbi:MAG: 5'-nucleotidase C-terminal domain-containing protein [Ignavibacteria bacterium]|nr:5'-nucleotidase C-terminal domain-containing protein [Ignavibacteria bacterium]MBT8383760.1 5'-nucleotidase C-terminal domain-containing protein [Ignavibacteria bacterium]NNJ52355.1 T9SS type A sorting domain-containing protein [Ignavibacteriaceae bacterium]NNL20472.1 T9SS type A sorting domain-containing protein [Ignavibacteriaceae bacterium]